MGKQTGNHTNTGGGNLRHGISAVLLLLNLLSLNVCQFREIWEYYLESYVQDSANAQLV